jgi:hypothetical protein
MSSAPADVEHALAAQSAISAISAGSVFAIAPAHGVTA